MVRGVAGKTKTKKRAATKTKASASRYSVETLALQLVDAKKKPAKIDPDAASFLPWLDAKAGSEMKAWNAICRKNSLKSSAGKFSVARGYTFTHAVRGVRDDGCWLARVRSLFLAMSPIFEEDEELHLATWWSSPSGKSVVWYSHQDEWDFQSPLPSIAAFVAHQLEEESEREELGVEVTTDLSAFVKRAWKEKVKIPAHLDAAAMQERTDWIVSLFLGIGGDDGLARAATMKTWQKEKSLAKSWPHLQAYWLLHHLVMDNREELPALVKMHEKKYPAARELAEWARLAIAGKPIQSKAWNAKKVLGLRVRALEAKKDFFTAAAKKRLADETTPMRAAAGNAKKARTAEPEAPLPGLFKLAQTLAGNTAGLEKALNERWNPDLDTQMKVMLWNRRGHATLLRVLLWSMTEDVDVRLRDFFEAKLAEGAPFEETHEKNVLGSIACLGVILGDFAAVQKIVTRAFGPVTKLGRLRRLELAVVAQRILETKKDDAALAFLRAEARRFAAQIDAWESDTAITAIAGLLRRKDPTAAELFNHMFQKANFSGANWSTLITFVDLQLGEIRDAAVIPGLRAALERDLGRHDDGDRGLVARAFGRIAGKAAVPVLEKLDAGIEDVRKQCERAAIVAGLVEAGGETYADRAAAALDALLAGNPSAMENGAAISLLRAIDERKLTGFADRAARVLNAAKKDEYSKASLVQWLSGASFA